MTVSIGLGRVGSNFFTCSGLGWVTQNGPMDNSDFDPPQIGIGINGFPLTHPWKLRRFYVRNLRLISLYTVHYFLHFCFHENVFTITPNALITPASGGLFRDKRGTGRKNDNSPPSPRKRKSGLGYSRRTPSPTSTIFWVGGSTQQRQHNRASAVYWTEDRGAML